MGDVGGELERQPGLAGAAGPGQREESGRSEQPGRLPQLGLATDEARQLGRKIVRPAVQGSDRREVGLQSVDDELEDTLGPEVLEPVLAEPADRDAIG